MRRIHVPNRVHRAPAKITGLITILFATVTLAAADMPPDYIAWSVIDGGISEPLAGLQGDPERGRQLVIDRRQGNCLACHQMPIDNEEFQGNLGPPLAGVAARLSEAQLRLRIVDERQLNPATVMPGYYRNPASLNRVASGMEGRTYFTPQQVEDVVAYLATLK